MRERINPGVINPHDSVKRTGEDGNDGCPKRVRLKYVPTVAETHEMMWRKTNVTQIKKIKPRQKRNDTVNKTEKRRMTRNIIGRGVYYNASWVSQGVPRWEAYGLGKRSG